MPVVLQKTFPLPFSLCDATGRLGVPDTFSLFMDLAGEHAHQLGMGIDDFLKRDLFWLTVRTRVRFYRRPRMLEPVTAVTFPEAPGAVRSNRCYQLFAGEELLAEGKTEWAISDTKTGAIVRPAALFPPDLTYRDPILPEPFMRLKTDFSDAREISRHRVRNADIDVGQHMNNVAYVYALADCFTVAEWNALPLREVEIAFRAPCHEGDELVWLRRDAGNTVTLAAKNGETVATLARLTLEVAPC